MYLIYLDESGTPDIKDSENFVIGGIILNEDRWFEVDKRVKDLKNKYYSLLNYSEFEIHMNDIINRKSVFNKLVPEQRVTILSDILDLINKLELRIVYIVIKKRLLKTNIDIRHWSYKLLFERICYQLKDMNNGKGKIEYGLLIFDSISPKKNLEISKIIYELLRVGSGYEKNEHLIDGPIFSESHLRSPLQIADCISYIINHHYKLNQNKDESMKILLEKGFSMLDNKMPCSKEYHRKVFPQ